MTSLAAHRTRDLLASLHDSLREAGLSGRVRVGVPLGAEETSIPQPRVITPLPSGSDRTDPGRARQGAATRSGTEEDVFSPDVLLRPTQPTSRGRLVEISGGISSGRTALAYRMAAGATARGELVGWVDLPDALDPRFLRRSGIDLGGLLWIRPPRVQAALRAAELLLKTGFGVVILDLEGASARTLERLGTAPWSRLLRIARGTRTTVVLLGPERIAGSFATLGLYTERRRALFDRELFEGLDGNATVVRNRAGPTDVAYPFRVLHRPTPSPR